MATALLSELRDECELLLSVPSGDSYIDSTQQLKDIQRAYEKTSGAYNWPQLLVRVGLPIVANVDRYALPTGFRKFHFLKVEDNLYSETELEFLKKSRRKYAIDRNASQLILSQVPTTASTTYTLSNAESAGSAVSIELDTVSGLSQFEEIFIDSASGTDEFTLVSSVGTLLITARLRAAKSASDVLYRQKAIIDMFYYRNPVALSGASDTMLIPDELDYTVCVYAAGLAFQRLEDYAKADKLFATWEQQVRAAFLAQDAQSTDRVGEMTIG